VQSREMDAAKRLILKRGGLAGLCFQGDRLWKTCLLWWVFWEGIFHFRGLDRSIGRVCTFSDVITMM